MPKLTIKAKNLELSVEKGENLMKALLRHNIPVASSCGGEGICSKCKVTVIAGKLAEPNEREAKIIVKDKLAANERLSCQNIIESDLQITTSYW